jgi:hypothetical protein
MNDLDSKISKGLTKIQEMCNFQNSSVSTSQNRNLKITQASVITITFWTADIPDPGILLFCTCSPEPGK